MLKFALHRDRYLRDTYMLVVWNISYWEIVVDISLAPRTNNNFQASKIRLSKIWNNESQRVI